MNIINKVLDLKFKKLVDIGNPKFLAGKQYDSKEYF